MWLQEFYEVVAKSQANGRRNLTGLSLKYFSRRRFLPGLEHLHRTLPHASG